MLPFLAGAKGSRASGAAGDLVWRPRLIRWEHSNHHLCAAKYPCTTGQVFHRRYRETLAKTMAKVYTTLSGFSSSLYSEESLQRRGFDKLFLRLKMKFGHINIW